MLVFTMYILETQIKTQSKLRVCSSARILETLYVEYTVGI